MYNRRDEETVSCLSLCSYALFPRVFNARRPTVRTVRGPHVADVAMCKMLSKLYSVFNARRPTVRTVRGPHVADVAMCKMLSKLYSVCTVYVVPTACHIRSRGNVSTTCSASI